MVKKREFNDWSKKTVNFCSGCSNDCIYCYAKGMSMRFGQVKEGEWSKMRIREHDVNKKHRNYGELVMFPSSHDITPKVLNEAVVVLDNLLKVRNDVLVVSKPRHECITRLCDEFVEYKDKILFRFTIGAMDNDILSFFERGASRYEERKKALRYAFNNGFNTSVSVEPVLDMNNVIDLFFDLEPFVSETIWIGKMNHVKKNIKVKSPEIDRVVKEQCQENCDLVYELLKRESKVRFKTGFINESK